jgi:hypothetical protein
MLGMLEIESLNSLVLRGGKALSFLTGFTAYCLPVTAYRSIPLVSIE